MTAQEYFKFTQQKKVMIFVDGNYMVNLSRALSIKIDMENLLNEITSEFFRQKTYWFSALEYNIDRNNNAFRFLDRLRYIPRTQVYTGKLTKRQGGNYETAFRTDAGSAMVATMMEQAMKHQADYFILIGIDPEFIPVVKMVQHNGILVRLVTADAHGELRAHPELTKIVDERNFLSEDFLHDFEYHSTNQYLDDEDEDEYYDEDDDVKSIDEKFEDEEELEEDLEEDLEIQTSEIDD